MTTTWRRASPAGAHGCLLEVLAAGLAGIAILAVLRKATDAGRWGSP